VSSPRRRARLALLAARSHKGPVKRALPPALPRLRPFPAPLLWAAVLGLAAAACDVPTPLAPAEPIGEMPRWGENFATPTEQPASALGPQGPGGEGGEGGTGETGEAGGLGNTGLPAGTASPGDTGSWSGGDAVLGKGVWTAMCARCHGEVGEGGSMPGGVRVPSLADPTWQASVEDKHIARSVMLGKGAMPSFMDQGLDRPKLAGLVAYIRTLKKQP
jgi:mono/diheme cytochrome c family protein